MDKRTFMKKFAIWTAVVVAVVMLIIGLCFGKVIEETLFGEMMKWVVMTAVIIGIFEVFAYTLGQLAYDIFVRPKNGDYE
jgi:undecaprenyl pyrophosphate phosphatase UppP